MKEIDEEKSIRRRNLKIVGAVVGGAIGFIEPFIVLGMSDGGFFAFMVSFPAAGLGAVLGVWLLAKGE